MDWSRNVKPQVVAFAASLACFAAHPARAEGTAKTQAAPRATVVEAPISTDTARIAWILRGGGGVFGFGGNNASSGSSAMLGLALEYYSAHLLTGRLYLLTGASFLLGKMSHSRCTVEECGEKDDPNLGQSQGFAGVWGPAATFAFKLAPGKEYLAIWFPELRLQQVIANRASHNDVCTQAFGKHGCSGWSFDNVSLTGGMGLELAHGDGMSCGLDVSVGWTFGALPGRNSGQYGEYAGAGTVLVNLIYNIDHYVAP